MYNREYVCVCVCGFFYLFLCLCVFHGKRILRPLPAIMSAICVGVSMCVYATVLCVCACVCVCVSVFL